MSAGSLIHYLFFFTEVSMFSFALVTAIFKQNYKRKPYAYKFVKLRTSHYIDQGNKFVNIGKYKDIVDTFPCGIKMRRGQVLGIDPVPFSTGY